MLVVLNGLRSDADWLVGESVARSTSRSYQRVMQKLEGFCQQHHIKDKFSAATIELFVTKARNDGLGLGAIRSMLSAIRHHCKSVNITASFDTPRLGLILRGIKRTAMSVPRRNRPVSLSILNRLCQAAPICFGKKVGRTVSAMFSLCFFALLRPSEAARSPASPQHQLLSKHVRLSANRISVKFYSFKHSVGPVKITVLPHFNKIICPVQNLLCHLPVPRKKPLFDFTAADFRFVLKKCLRHCGIKRHITPHSFRSGGATFYSANGMTDATLKAKGRWRSNAYLSYVRS